jgi:hypothetical protein
LAWALSTDAWAEAMLAGEGVVVVGVLVVGLVRVLPVPDDDAGVVRVVVVVVRVVVGVVVVVVRECVVRFLGAVLGAVFGVVLGVVFGLTTVVVVVVVVDTSSCVLRTGVEVEVALLAPAPLLVPVAVPFSSEVS